MTTPMFDELVEMYLRGGWRNVTQDLRHNDGRAIEIETGLQDQSGKASSKCDLVMGNTSGDYSPRNAMGQWFGAMKKNVPLRVGSRVTRDLYTPRAAANGWGTTSQSPKSFAWSTSGGAVGDYAVTAGVATHTLTSTAVRLSYLNDVTLSDVELRATFQAPVPTGGPIYINVCFRGVGTDKYRGQIAIMPSGSVTVQYANYFDGVLQGAPVAIPGIVYTGQKLRVASHRDCDQWRTKVWDPAGLEPYAWNLESSGYSGQPLPGYVGIDSSKDVTNTNGTITLSYTDIEVIVREFHGEVSSFDPYRDLSGNEQRMSITAQGPLRRLRSNQNSQPLQSPARRALRNAPGMVAYWPGEDGSGAGQMSSVRSDWAPMTFVGVGSPSLASNTSFVSSAPLPVIGVATVDGQIQPYTTPTPSVIQMRWLLDVDASSTEPPNDESVIRWYCEGSAAYWIVRYQTGGGIRIQVEDTAEVPLFNTVLPANINNRQLLCNLDATQNGANIDWRFMIGEPNVPVPVWSGTINSQTLGRARSVTVGTDKHLGSVAMGHFIVQSQITSFFEFINPLSGWRGEPAHSRFLRICAEQSIPAQADGGGSVVMGPQPIAAPMDFLDQTVAVDQGLPYEGRYKTTVGYVASQALNNRAVRLTLDFTKYQLFDELPVKDDDILTANSVTAETSNSNARIGSSVTMVQTTGPLAAVPAEQGGIDVYDVRYPVNTNTLLGTADLAGFLLMAGTIDQPRVPSVTVWLESPDIYGDIPTLLGSMDVREGSVLALAKLPLSMASDTLRETVIGVRKRITGKEYAVSWNTVPGEKYQVATLDDLGSRVEAGAAFLAANVASPTATSISVKSLDGTTFTTDPAEFPFDIRVGGERMRVTAIAGTASPQTFTVTRSINGVSKTHTADDAETARVSIVSYSVVALA